MKKYIPNALTLANLFFGCVATVFAIKGQLEMASFFVFAGIFCDFFDGFAARTLGVQSELGIQLDSLADLVTCGVVPGVIMFQLLSLTTANTLVWEYGSGWEGEEFTLGLLPLLGFAITLASAYRLAKFNIDEDQVTSFKGLPTPANTLFIISFPLILAYQESELMNTIIINPWFLIGITLLSAYMLNSRVTLFALKFKSWGFAANAVKYIFLILSLVLLIVLQFAAIPLLIVLYVLLSVWESRKNVLSGI